MGKAKSISIVLNDGTTDGVMILEDDEWYDGLLLAVSRDMIDKLLSMEESQYWGVYLLLCHNKVYIGKTSEIKTRIKVHLKNKNWWKQVFILTTKANTLDTTDVEYVEKLLIEKAKANNMLDSDNYKGGNKTNPKRQNKVTLDKYIDEALFVLEFIGVDVFKDHVKSETSYVKLVDKMVAAIKDKKDVLSFLKERGFDYKWADVSYASRGQSRDEYAIDVNNSLLEKDWDIVLNDNQNYEIILICMKSSDINKFGKKNFKEKNQDTKRVRINPDSLKDATGLDFSKFIVARIPYSSTEE